jgi:tRNA-2-methylthio-N6-dimethylallyladenosine synthase
MTDHIVVFDGHERLIGRTIPVLIEDASAFTLFGEVMTTETLVGRDALLRTREQATEAVSGRIELPLIA